MSDTTPATWQPYGRRHVAYLSSSVLVIEHMEDNPYLWVWAIWVRFRDKDVLLRTGTHNGTEAGAKQAVADAAYLENADAVMRSLHTKTARRWACYGLD